MLTYFIKRLGLAAVIVSVAMFILFCMIYLIPGDPASVALGPRATEEMRASLSHHSLRIPFNGIFYILVLINGIFLFSVLINGIFLFSFNQRHFLFSVLINVIFIFLF